MPANLATRSIVTRERLKPSRLAIEVDAAISGVGPLHPGPEKATHCTCSRRVPVLGSRTQGSWRTLPAGLCRARNRNTPTSASIHGAGIGAGPIFRRCVMPPYARLSARGRTCCRGVPLFAGGKIVWRTHRRRRQHKLVVAVTRRARDCHLPGVSIALRRRRLPRTTRAAHLCRRADPLMLFLQGTRDELADLTLLEPVTQKTRQARDAGKDRSGGSWLPRAGSQWPEPHGQEMTELLDKNRLLDRPHSYIMAGAPAPALRRPHGPSSIGALWSPPLPTPARRSWTTADVDPRHALSYWVDTICSSLPGDRDRQPRPGAVFGQPRPVRPSGRPQ